VVDLAGRGDDSQRVMVGCRHDSDKRAGSSMGVVRNNVRLDLATRGVDGIRTDQG